MKPRSGRRHILAALVVAQACNLSAGERAPRIAVWDPGRDGESSRFVIDKAFHDRVAAWLQEGGVETARMTTEQVADPDCFPADRFDALMLQGGAFPEANLAAYLRFLDAGGVLVALAAPNGFEIKIAQDRNGIWRLAPEAPPFAWQTEAVHHHVGLEFRWQTDMVYAGVRHAPSDLWRACLPEATEVERPLPARWFVPMADGAIHPLMRSRMATGEDYTPQIFVARRGTRRAIVCASGLWTGGPGADPSVWPHARATVLALARLARDLRLGNVDLSGQATVQPPTEIVSPPPLAFRGIAVGIDPEGARPLARWGTFDGSRIEFGPTLAEGGTARVPVGAPKEAVPGGIGPKAGIVFDLPPPVRAAVDVRLRLRAAVADAGVRLRLAAADNVLWHEEIVLRDSDGEVNLGHRYGDVPLEFNRVVFVPPGAMAAGHLELANTGAGTLHLDALQIEEPVAPARRIELGLHTSTELAYDHAHALTPERCRDWSTLRCTTRTWWVGPPEEPARWERFDRHVERYLALHPRPQFILEGTPAWAALNARRWAEGGSRRHMTPPDPGKFAAMTERIVRTYADRVQDWEIWNEANIRHFWQGTPEEFAAFHLTVAPIIRRHAPSARVIVAGMAGVEKRSIDPFALAMSRSGALAPAHADLYGMHCYSPQGMWDVPCGLIEGHLMALGEGIEIYPNEQGYRVDKTGPDGQALFNDRGTARLFATGVAKITIFQSDGPPASFGVIDEHGNPRPAYTSFLDYLELARRDGRRLDVSMTAPAGAPLKGVYVAAARHEDGTVTLVVNPADHEDFLPPPPAPDDEFDAASRGRWNCFWGTAEWRNGLVTITSDGKHPQAGFFRKLKIDPARHPEIEVSVPETAGRWQLMVKHGDNQTIPLVDSNEPGVFRKRFADALPSTGVQDVEISFRVSRVTTFDHVRFPVDEAAVVGMPAPLPVTLRVPLPDAGPWRVSAVQGPLERTATVRTHASGKATWAEIETLVGGRTVLRLTR